MATTDADRIAADGSTITLRDGREVNVRLGFLALRSLEKAYGSLDAVFAAIEVNDNESVTAGTFYGPFFDLLVAGLTDEGLTEAECDRLLDPARMTDYTSALTAAIEEAFPASKGAPGKAPAPRKRAASRGKPSTSSPPSSTDDPTSSSGE